jgi:hypothetical protein
MARRRRPPAGDTGLAPPAPRALVEANWDRVALQRADQLESELDEKIMQSPPRERPRRPRNAYKQARRQALRRLAAAQPCRAPRRAAPRPRRPGARRPAATRAGPDDPDPARACVRLVWRDHAERFSERLHLSAGRCHEIRSRFRRACPDGTQPEIGEQP